LFDIVQYSKPIPFESFNNPIPIDWEELRAHKDSLIRSISDNIRKKANLQNWIVINTVANGGVPLYEGMNWLDLDEFWMSAITDEVNDYIREQNKSQQQSMQKIQDQISDKSSHNRSVFNDIPKPKFLS